MVLVAQLREYSDQQDADVVKGVLTVLFEGLPPAIRDKKYENKLHEAAYCYGAALEDVTKQDLVDDCGVPPGVAKMIIKIITEPMVVQVMVQSPLQVKSALRPFPPVGRNGWPTVREFEAFSEGFESRVELSIGADTMQCVGDQTVELPDDYDEGGEDDKLLYRVLINEAKLPADTVALVPQELRKKKAGLAVWRLIVAGVHTRSSEVSLKVTDFATKPTPVEPAQRANLTTIWQQIQFICCADVICYLMFLLLIVTLGWSLSTKIVLAMHPSPAIAN